jgi:hypothetical protein
LETQKSTERNNTKRGLENVLKNIYQNLIDEDDIIMEEESKEGVSSL